jgi:hypothetical protein
LVNKNPQQAQELLAPFIDAIIGSVLSKVRSSLSNDNQGVASLIVGGITAFAKPEVRKSADQLMSNIGNASKC